MQKGELKINSVDLKTLIQNTTTSPELIEEHVPSTVEPTRGADLNLNLKYWRPTLNQMPVVYYKPHNFCGEVTTHNLHHRKYIPVIRQKVTGWDDRQQTKCTCLVMRCSQDIETADQEQLRLDGLLEALFALP
jgi:hypothetical protein